MSALASVREAWAKAPPRRRWLLRTAFEGLGIAAALIYATVLTHGLRATPPPAALPTAPDRLGIPEQKRRAIFAELAGDEPRARKESAEKFPGDAWSIEDERAAHERDRTRALASAHKLSVSTVYLILDEGIRAQWLAPNKKPLDATVVPLKPRFR
ncbi:MAG: hypothetical protein ACRELY_15220 [Polyangiaceae bacterium]